MPTRRKIAKKPEKPLDTFFEKRQRGRPARVRPSEIRGRADHYRSIFDQVWERLWPSLSQAQTDQEIIGAFVEQGQPYAPNFMPGLANLVFRVLRDPKFKNAQRHRSPSWRTPWRVSTM